MRVASLFILQYICFWVVRIEKNHVQVTVVATVNLSKLFICFFFGFKMLLMYVQLQIQNTIQIFNKQSARWVYSICTCIC